MDEDDGCDVVQPVEAPRHSEWPIMSLSSISMVAGLSIIICSTLDKAVTPEGFECTRS